MSITPFTTITLKASPDGVLDEFMDDDSIQANSIRAYNTSTVEAFLSVGSIVDFPVPPNDSIVVAKPEGVGKLSAKTESGSAVIRCTAIKETNSDGDSMGILSGIAILKDALDKQYLIDKAAKKIADANKISDANKKEAQDAANIIADAKSATLELALEMTAHDTKVAEHNDYVNKKTAELESKQNEINKKKLELEALHQEHLDKIAEMQAKAEKRHADADVRETELDKRDKKSIEDERVNIANNIANTKERRKLNEDIEALATEKEKFEARKKKIAAAAMED
jgi:hypothetical protein